MIISKYIALAVGRSFRPQNSSYLMLAWSLCRAFARPVYPLGRRHGLGRGRTTRAPQYSIHLRKFVRQKPPFCDQCYPITNFPYSPPVPVCISFNRVPPPFRAYSILSLIRPFLLHFPEYGQVSTRWTDKQVGFIYRGAVFFIEDEAHWML